MNDMAKNGRPKNIFQSKLLEVEYILSILQQKHFPGMRPVQMTLLFLGSFLNRL